MQNLKIENALKQVRQRFCQKLSNWLPILVEYYENVAAKQIEPENMTSIIRAEVHKISGSAKTFGFSGLSEQAQKVEQLLDQLINGKELDLIHRELMNALDEFIMMISKTIDNFSDTEIEENQSDIDNNTFINKEKIIEDKFNVLVVDDDELINDFFAYGLEEEMFNVVQCTTGQETLDYLSKTHNQNVDQPEKHFMPDLILLDVNLPDQSGFDVLLKVKQDKHFEDIPVLMLTRESDDDAIIKGFTNGANDYITKPFDTHELIDKIKYMLKQQKTQLLLADDDQLILEYVADYFKKKGYRVLTENNGYDALMTMQLKSPDIAIIDVMMPGIDGISTLQKAKKDPRIADIPIIIMSAKNQQESIVTGLSSGAHDYVVKPFDIDELSARVTGILLRNKNETVE